VIDKLEQLEERYDQLSALMADPATLTDNDKLRNFGREQAELEPIVSKFREYKANQQALKEAEALL
jgi:peptide chain release factor 1